MPRSAPALDRAAGRAALPAYAAALWAGAHATLSAYWAVGGTAGLGLLSEGVVELALARPPWFVALVAGVAAAKAAAAGLALALVRPWGRRFPRWLLLAGAWGAGLAFTGYAAAGLVPGILIAVGGFEPPGPVDPASRWYLLLWYPLWLLGGVLFLAAAWRATRRRAPRHAPR